MAKQKKTKKTTTTTTTSNRSTVNLCAFWAMVIAAFTYIFSGVIRLILSCVGSIAPKTASALSTVVTIFQFVGNIALIIAIALPAYNFVRGKNKNWKAVYWIALVFFAFGVVLGMLGGIL